MNTIYQVGIAAVVAYLVYSTFFIVTMVTTKSRHVCNSTWKQVAIFWLTWPNRLIIGRFLRAPAGVKLADNDLMRLALRNGSKFVFIWLVTTVAAYYIMWGM